MISIQNGLFCSKCGDYKEIPLIETTITCKKCEINVNIKDVEFNFHEESKTYEKEKSWTRPAMASQQINKDNEKEQKTIEQRCVNPKCDSNLCFYTARQLRSADEGQTIFYHCIKCGERFTLNT